MTYYVVMCNDGLEYISSLEWKCQDYIRKLVDDLENSQYKTFSRIDYTQGYTRLNVYQKNGGDLNYRITTCDGADTTNYEVIYGEIDKQSKVAWENNIQASLKGSLTESRKWMTRHSKLQMLRWLLGCFQCNELDDFKLEIAIPITRVMGEEVPDIFTYDPNLP